jgi:hypothetical protein
VSYLAPERLAAHHELADFLCSSEEQTTWLREYARQADAARTSTVFVVTEESGTVVVAYYAWCMASVRIDRAPARLRKGAGRYPQPVALLSRLGTDIRHERKGLGAALMTDMFRRLMALSGDIGCRGLLIHCETPEAREFYRHLVPEFMPGPTDELHLYLLLKDIRKTLDRAFRQTAHRP